MTAEQVVALFGAAVLALVVRLFNVIVAWLARVLRVQPPDPIPTSAPGSGRDDHGQSDMS